MIVNVAKFGLQWVLSWLPLELPVVLSIRSLHSLAANLAHEMAYYVAFYLLSPYDPVSAYQAPILFIPCLAHHFEKPQVKQDILLLPEPVSEPSHRHLVYIEGTCYSGERPALPQSPQDEPLLIGIQPGMSVLRASPGRVVFVSFVQRWRRHSGKNSTILIGIRDT